MKFETVERKIKSEIEELMICDCGGIMIFTGMTLTSNPPKYVHQCNKCGRNNNSFSIYPLRYFTYEGDEKNENE